MISQFSNAVSHTIVRPVDQNLQAKEKIGKRKRNSSQAICEYKYAKNAKMTKSQKKYFFFFKFEDMIVWFKVGGNTSFGVILDAI